MISESYPHDSVTVAKDDCEPATVKSYTFLYFTQ